jgi:hypothetical protein
MQFWLLKVQFFFKFRFSYLENVSLWVVYLNCLHIYVFTLNCLKMASPKDEACSQHHQNRYKNESSPTDCVFFLRRFVNC